MTFIKMFESLVVPVRTEGFWRILGCRFRIIWLQNYNDVILSTMTSQTTSLTIVYATVYSGTDQRIHKSSASLAFMRGIHRWPVNSPHKGPVTRKRFPLDDVIINWDISGLQHASSMFIQHEQEHCLFGWKLIPPSPQVPTQQKEQASIL